MLNRSSCVLIMVLCLVGAGIAVATSTGASKPRGTYVYVTRTAPEGSFEGMAILSGVVESEGKRVRLAFHAFRVSLAGEKDMCWFNGHAEVPAASNDPIDFSGRVEGLKISVTLAPRGLLRWEQVAKSEDVTVVYP